MRKENIQQVRKDAKRVIEIVDVVLREIDESSLVLITGTKNTGTLRRVSMDMTRSLAKMRNEP